MSDQNPLGKTTVYPSQYQPDLLFPIARKLSREPLGISETLPFTGYDRWTAYELSWLDSQGKPNMRVAEFVVAADSPTIIESKSFKLYLNSLNQTIFPTEKQLTECIQKDVSKGFGTSVSVRLFKSDDIDCDLTIKSKVGHLLDDLTIEVNQYEPRPTLLKVNQKIHEKHKILYSHLLKTNCPITDQPDWGTVYIEYTGKKIIPESLLAYIISFRQHQGYHENCVEQIFCDITHYCKPENLTVYARYSRRGGLDINPLRTSYSKDESQLWGKVLRTLQQ